MKKLISIVLFSLLGFLIIIQPVSAAENIGAAKLFEINCAGCHPRGGNIIKRGKTLRAKDLKKYNMDSVGAIVSIVSNGKGVMSAFQDRLTPEEINSVSLYVLERANSDWKK